MPRFIALDGEGLSRDDGTHDYTLLASSEKTYIETRRLGGLGTVECLQFLMETQNLNPDAVLVGFFTSYDVNMILKDLPVEQLARLWTEHECTWRPSNPSLPNFEQYRIKYVPNRVFEVLQGFWYWDERRKRYGWHHTAKFIWWDVFQFFQSSFVKAIREWKVTDDETVASIERMKKQRSTFEDTQESEIREYCFDECRLLVVLMDRLTEAIEAAGINLNQWYGSGAIAASLLKAHGIKKHVKHEEKEAPETDPILRAYFGGRIETFAVGINEGATYNYDIRSAYPAAIRNLPSLRDSRWEHTKRYRQGYEFAVWHVKWECPARSAVTPFPYRYKQHIYWPRNGEGWYHEIEVAAAISVAQSLGWKIRILEGWILHPTSERPFADWVPEMYERRAEYKRAGNSAEKPLKLGINSLYGKMAQSQSSKKGSIPPFRSYFWAGYITAHCRATLLLAAGQAVQKPRNLMAIATDGIFTREPLELHEGPNLGDWESSVIEPGLIFLQPGVYMSPSKKIVKTRGFSAAAIDYEEVARKWRTDRFDATVTIPNTQFIGFGFAFARNRLGGERNIWRTWQHGYKEIRMGGTSTKSPDFANDWASDIIWLLPPSVPSNEISAPYKPRDGSLRSLIEEEIDNAAMDSQPDSWDNPFIYSKD